MNKGNYILLIAMSAALVLTGYYAKMNSTIKAEASSKNDTLAKEMASISQKVDLQNEEIQQLQSSLRSKDEQISKLNEKIKKLEGSRIIKLSNAHVNFRKQQAKIADLQVIHSYGGLIRKLKLEGEKRDELISLIKKYQDAYNKNLLSMMKEKGKKVVVLSGHQNIMENTAEEKALREFLGDDFEQFESYKRYKAFRLKVQTLNKNIDAKNRLDVKQQEQLVKLLHDLNNNSEEGKSDYLKLAEKFLNKEQCSALQKQLQNATKNISINVDGNKRTIRLGENIIITP